MTGQPLLCICSMTTIFPSLVKEKPKPTLNTITVK